MTDRPENACDPGAAPQAPDAGEAAGPSPERELLARLGGLRDEFAQWFAQAARLFGAETRLFATSLLLIVALAVVAGFVVAGALLALAGAGVGALVVHGGMDPVWALLLACVALLGVAAACVVVLRRLTRHLRFTETRRMFARLGGDTDGEGRP